MTDLAEIEAFETGYGKRCAVSVELDPLTSHLNDDDRAFIERSIDNNERGKTYLYDAFARLGLHAYPTAANFIAVQVPTEANVAYEALLSKGVIVRSGDGLNMPGRLRVSIGTPEENQAFIAALEALLPTWR